MLRRIVQANRRGEAVGVCSVCSAHPWVLSAALAEARRDGTFALIESTSNQVNQHGGYTGQTPAVFATSLRRLAAEAGLEPDRVLLGGDHLGPYPWRRCPAREAMAEACRLVRDCVLAGYVKIHLDASMPCADDGAGIDPERAAARSAELCAAAEQAWRERSGVPPLYVIGTEVPAPGGEQTGTGPLAVTRPEDARATIELHRQAFARRGLEDAFERIIGLVVQPGVDFSAFEVHDYDRARAAALRDSLPASPELVYEAHSTDYQLPRALAEMVEDHFAILKVGPWLTFALREAVLALSAIEQEWLGGRRGVKLSRVWEALEAAMLADPSHWRNYYTGTEDEQRLARKYALSDRVRYYWAVSEVQAEVERLLGNLRAAPPPATLISQFLPAQYEALREGELEADPLAWIEHRIAQVLRVYAAAGRPATTGRAPSVSPTPSRTP
jgi:D-tagatose-1,6-bisphosphate aldolase subunit GatZ/KbaZ